jgi:transglutaminase-like putative cysteine protease
MLCSINHVTKFRYSAPITESVMELRMQPLSEGIQHCLKFDLALRPAAAIKSYRDYLGNTVHHFDIPASHSQLTITAKALVEMLRPPILPDALELSAWEELAKLVASGNYFDMLMPSRFTNPTDLLRQFARKLELPHGSDPLTMLRGLNQAIFNAFEYAPQSTRVDSAIDDALSTRQGVCQDFSHIMIALVRDLNIPCRYVSGYLYHRDEHQDRSAQDATHAWVEAFLPDLGWVGFDPTNNLIASDRHIRVAVGRDYADVPPTKGVFKGIAESTLSVGVQVKPPDEPLSEEELKVFYELSQSTTDADQIQQQQQQ